MRADDLANLEPPRRSTPLFQRARLGHRGGYGLALLVVLGVTALAGVLDPILSDADRLLGFLLGVVVVAWRFSLGPSLVAAVASVVALNFFFLLPRYTFKVADPAWLVTLAVMTVVGIVISGLTVRMRHQREAAARREERTAALYAFSRALGSADDAPSLAAIAADHIARAFATDVTLVLVDGGTPALAAAAGPPMTGPDEAASVQWTLDHAEPTGAGTSRPARGAGLYLPLAGASGTFGVLALGVRDDEVGLPEQRETLQAFVSHTALALERARVAALHRRSELDLEAERMRASLLSSVSHDLRTPLATILGASAALLEGPGLDPARRIDLLESVHEEAERLHGLVRNLLEMTRVSGRLEPNLEWHVPQDVVGAALERLRRSLGERPVRVRCDVGLASLDAVLVDLALTNLVENAGRHSGPHGPIDIEVALRDGAVEFVVRDRGTGFDPAEAPRLFDKFYRASGAVGIGSGLGLAIVRAVAEAHGGRAWAALREDGPGAVFGIALPQPDEIPEDVRLVPPAVEETVESTPG